MRNFLRLTPLSFQVRREPIGPAVAASDMEQKILANSDTR